MPHVGESLRDSQTNRPDSQMNGLFHRLKETMGCASLKEAMGCASLGGPLRRVSVVETLGARVSERLAYVNI